MKRTLLVLSLGLFAAGCGDDDDNNNVTKGPETCAEVIAAKKADATVAAALAAGWSTDDVASMHTAKTWVDADGVTQTATPNHTRYAGTYRDDLTTHPGCVARTAYTGTLYLNGANQATVASGIPVQSTNSAAAGYLAGFTCAAKLYDMPAGVTVDTNKPIIILAHGNSSSPNSWEEYANSALADQNAEKEGVQLKSASLFEFTADTETREMLASKLVAQGYQVYAADYRTDLVPYLVGVAYTAAPTDPTYGDMVGNVDHGWSVPIFQALVKKVMEANPTRKVSLVGHSLGYTVIQDSLRRLYKEYKAGTWSINPYSRVKDLVLASGAAHGVVNGKANCDFYETMRGSVNCEMGDRDNYLATDFGKMLNGPQDLFSVPCADGSFAYGDEDACGGNTVQYTTITMKDVKEGGKLHDEFVSESAARLNMDVVVDAADGTKTVEHAACVDNHVIAPTDFDSSGFFMDITGFNFQGFLANHFGSVRSDNGMDYVLQKLAD